ncbi:MAG: hypothetical protein HKP56_18310 [Anderseniella sp.]|nr:hypothetical protein [Anderseniella sp.]
MLEARQAMPWVRDLLVEGRRVVTGGGLTGIDACEIAEQGQESVARLM